MNVQTTASPGTAQTQYAGFWIRLCAYCWDVLIIGIPSFIISIALVTLTGIASFQYLVSLAIIALTIYLDGDKGGTPGKLLLGLRIQDEKGSLIGVPVAILRNVGKCLSGLVLCIGFIRIGVDARKQGWHDSIAGTFVVQQGQQRTWLAVTGVIIAILLLILGIAVFFWLLLSAA